MLNQKGQGLTEYLMLVMLIAVVSITITQSLGKTIRRKIDVVQNHINKDIKVED